MNKMLKVKDIMSVNVISFGVDTLMSEIVTTMQTNKISSVIIADGKKPLGIITERDIVKASLSPDKTLQMSVTDIMSSPVKTMPSYADYRDAYMQMSEQKIRHIVVTDRQGELVGVISQSNFLNHLSPDQLLAIKEISKVMTKRVLTCKPNDTLRSVLEQMVDKRVGGIVVEQNNKPVGIISERDTLKFIQESKVLLNQEVSRFMSSPVATIYERQTVLNAQSIMKKLAIRRLVVVDDKEQIAGVVSHHDLIKHIPEYYVEILREMIERQKSLVTTTQAKLDEKVIFQNAIKSLPHTLVLMTQTQGVIQFVNIQTKGFCNIPRITMGDTLHDLKSNFFELIQNNTWKDKVLDGKTVHKIIKMEQKSGTSCYLHTSISAIFDEANSFEGYLYIARDISQEQTLELELKRLTHQLQEAYKVAKIGNFELDANTLNAFWSDEVCDIFGVKKGTIGGPEVLKTVVTEKDFEVIKSSLLSALQTGSNHDMIYEVFPKDGSKSRWVECKGRNELNEDGTPKCLVGTVQDITQRVEAQKEARENEDSMILALESAGHGVWDYNVKENTQYLSPQYKTMLGYDKNEMDNTLEFFLSLLHRDDVSNVQSTIKSFITNKHHKGDKFHQTFRMKTKDGVYKWILSNGNVISTEEDGTIVRVIGTHTDITEQKQAEEELRLFKRSVESAKEGITITKADNDRETIYVNPAFEKLTGYSSEEIVGKNLRLLNEKNREQPEIELIHNAIENQKSIEVALKNYRKDGSEFISQLSIDPVFDETNTVTHFIGFQKDITERKKMEQALSKEKERYKKAERIAQLGSWELNTLHDILIWSDEVYRIFEIDASKEMTFDDFIQRVHPEDKESVQEAYQTSIQEHKPYHTTHRLLFADERIKYVSEDVQHFYDANDTHISSIGTVQDITALKETQAQLDFLAYHDHLTKLPNRILLNERLKHTLNSAKRQKHMTAIIFMDLDNFKNINDSYGHSFGDKLLIAVSYRLKRIIREEDTVSRIGGDEFVVVSSFKKLKQITHLAQKIMKQFEEPFAIEKQEFWISVSIGISVAPDDGNSSETLIKNADTAMYQAKGDGKKTVKFYNDKMSANSFERVVFENALKSGIKNKEFEVYYQPQEKLQDDSLLGFEALVRWRHPTLGLVPPDKFISIAEETKMILDIGKFVLEQSCKAIKQWHDEGLCRGRIAVNVSGVQLEHSNFEEILKQILIKYDVTPSMIEIEVTESMVMKNPDKWINILQEIHRIGVCISIDDFGTGYSSLSYLRRLPIDTLKIDQSFIQDIPKEQDACAIVDAIINMANSLGLDTLAEGVETASQRKYLMQKSCKYAQGYLLSKPMSRKDTYDWLSQKHLRSLETPQPIPSK